MRVRCLPIAALLVALPAGATPWTLPAAVERAIEANPRARIAAHRIAAARARLDRAAAEFLPVLELRSGYTRTSNPMLAFGAILNQESFRPELDFNDVPDTDDLNLSGRLRLPLFAGGARFAGLRAAHAGQRASEEDLTALRNTIALEVARAFYSILKGRAFARAAEAGVRAFEANLEVARSRLAEGTALRTDVLDLEVRLSRAREDLVRAQNATALAERALRNLLGLDSGEATAAEPPPPIPTPSSLDPSGRPELRAAAERVRAAEAAVRRAMAGYLPRLEAFADTGYDRGWETGGDGRHYTVRVALAWNLWDGWRTRAEVAQARADLEAAREQQRQVRLAIDLEVEQARLALTEASRRLEVAERAVQHARESAELTRERFREGLAIATQLLDAETELIAARVRRAEAESDLRIAIASLRKAVGLPPVPLDARAQAAEEERQP